MAVATDAAWVQDQVSWAVGQGWRLGSVRDRLGLWLGVAPRRDMPSVIIREIFAFRIFREIFAVRIFREICAVRMVRALCTVGLG